MYQPPPQTPVHTPVTLVVAAPFPLVREALSTLLDSDPQIRVIGGAVDARDAVSVAQALRPAVLLLHDAMPDATTAATLRELTRQAPAVRTLLIECDDDPAYALEALALGARGVVAKRSPTALLFKSVRVVSEGGYWVARTCLDLLLDQLRDRGAWPHANSKATHGLSARELEVVATIAA